MPRFGGAYIKITLNADNAWPDLKEKRNTDKFLHIAQEGTIEIAGLPGGMKSGQPSVCMRFDHPNGTTLIAETSLQLFLAAADALKARYGDPRFPGAPQGPPGASNPN